MNDPSSHPGMGAVPYEGGVAFRVWAPFADQVYVTGSFDQWAGDQHALASEGDGYWSVDVLEAEVGDEYKYVIHNGSAELWRIDPYAKQVTGSQGNGVVFSNEFDWGDEDFHMPPWNELVVYEMHVGTFNDQPGGPPGNLTGVIERLPHLVDLGVNAIQIMPSLEFAGGFSWGYNPAYIFAIEEEYGGPIALKALIRAAHQLGVAVIMDLVYNHLGPSDLDLWQFDGWQENGKGGIYFYNDWRSITPWGDTRPDYGRGEVRRYLRDNALYWVSDFRVDGLRWDATAYLRNVYGLNQDPDHDLPDGWSLMQWINEEVNARQPWKINIAEDLRYNAWLTKDVSAGGAGFDAQWDPAFVHPVREAIIPPQDENRNMYAVGAAILSSYNRDAFERVIYTESHDEVANGQARVPQEIWPDNPGSYFSKKRSTLGAALVFTSPGIPMIFQGQEFLEDEWFRDTDPIDWSKLDTYSGIVQLYRDLIRLRRNWFDNTCGLRGQHVNLYHINDYDKVIAFHRWEQGGPGDDVVVAANFSNRGYPSYNLGFPGEGLWRVRFNSDWRGYSEDFGDQLSLDTHANQGARDGLPCNGSVGLGPYSAIILSMDRE